VHGLLERVQREKAKTGLDGLFVSAGLLVIREQTPQPWIASSCRRIRSAVSQSSNGRSDSTRPARRSPR
jgi:hypothetical protein